MKELRIQPAAVEDAETAAQWYEAQRPGFDTSVGSSRKHQVLILRFETDEAAICKASPSRYICYSRIANTECANMLKPQDIVIVAKILSKGDNHRAQSHIAAELQMSPSEVNAGMKRAVKSGLLRQEGSRYEPVKAAISEFLLHGLKYAFPAERGQPTRGLPTSYAAAPLNEHIAMGSDLPPVWPHPQGDTRGYELKPLYRSVPAAAKADPMLYQFLAVADALRDGAVRDKKIAEQVLKVLLRGR